MVLVVMMVMMMMMMRGARATQSFQRRCSSGFKAAQRTINTARRCQL
ncbi:hypothetical protein EYF80_067077 [Liparis tanakae]|uniref:Uncharacterized protein n=1 Tax=Liparis tanakae TaxID=230148 RepID=A0A4Z2E1Q8_9TELE|nr:hypothetical protein EYF80_067077 [Liparis tanakae]